jgi:hypothetical protein
LIYYLILFVLYHWQISFIISTIHF